MDVRFTRLIGPKVCDFSASLGNYPLLVGVQRVGIELTCVMLARLPHLSVLFLTCSFACAESTVTPCNEENSQALEIRIANPLEELPPSNAYAS